ncbi:transposase [Paraburkholderia sp. WC7.3g]
MKSATLDKLQQAARDNAVRLVYFDEAGFAASPPVQRAWSPRGLPHCIEPRFHCRRSVLGALDFGANALTHHVASSSIKCDAVVEFLDQIAMQGNDRPTIVVLDNASIHHAIDSEVHERWLREHRMQLFYLPPYSPELNLIEIVWKHAKYHWRRFVTWTKETIDAEIGKLLAGYGSEFEIRFA